MTRFSVRWAVPMLAGVALMVAGCDSPPEAEKTPMVMRPICASDE